MRTLEVKSAQAAAACPSSHHAMHSGVIPPRATAGRPPGARHAKPKSATPAPFTAAATLPITNSTDAAACSASAST